MFGEDARVELEQHKVIHAIETRVARGHGTEADKELLTEAAQLIRYLVGLSPTERLRYPPPAAYGPVKNDLPIGHSLPIADSDRKV